MNVLERVLAVLTEHAVDYCIIGGQAVNAYVEPVVSLDLALVIAVDRVTAVEAWLSSLFTVRRFEPSLKISAPGSDLRVQIQLDPRYGSFLERARPGEILGLSMPVASPEDVLRGKVWAAQDPARRASKRQKDLADIARLLEAYPALRNQVPGEILARLV